MDIKIADLREPRKVELWGIIIITCFNFAFLIAVVSHMDISVLLMAPLFWLFFGCSQLWFAVVLYELLQFYKARAGIDEMHDAAVACNKSQEIYQQREKELLETIRVQTRQKDKNIKDPS